MCVCVHVSVSEHVSGCDKSSSFQSSPTAPNNLKGCLVYLCKEKTGILYNLTL